MLAVFKRLGSSALPMLLALTAGGETTNSVSLASTPLPDVGVSLLRVLGALALVLAVFLGGIWLFRNWQRLVVQRGRAPRLNVLEVRSLGGRHALYVVGYEQERFLIAASPSGVHLVSHLQPAGEESLKEAAPSPASFARALTHMLKAESPTLGKAGELS
jgi:flagellar biogenesis protein FliO